MDDTIRGVMQIISIRRGASGQGPQSIRVRWTAILTAGVLAVTAAVIGASSASAEEYPTWADVAAARNNVAATAEAVARIDRLMAALQAEVVRTQADAEAKGNIYQEADDKYQASAARAARLQEQADAASLRADASEQRAGQMAAQLLRSGGQDLTASLFADSSNAEDLLYGLEMSQKIGDQAGAIYERATQDRNSAQSQTDAADVARAELEVLRNIADAAFVEAQAASVVASVALEEQRVNQAVLQQQLVVLRSVVAVTEADYLAGVAERERIRAEEAAAAPSLDAGEISLSGWARPAGGSITSGYGERILYGQWNNHKGVDLAPGCGAGIFAAAGGTVVYASEGWNGGYGNYIIIDHGDGVRTAYGHIQPGGILVSAGQAVGPGNNIARVGTTGNSTGCHLHFEVRINGDTTNPVPFMANQGITLG